MAGRCSYVGSSSPDYFRISQVPCSKMHCGSSCFSSIRGACFAPVFAAAPARPISCAVALDTVWKQQMMRVGGFWLSWSALQPWGEIPPSVTVDVFPNVD